ncbi:polyprenol monophosphomannose synthase [Amnibacterium flavum]|uniref:Dolichol-phosphate mannosyltransferase n=1 Tax=Amnibacterium flavum TaxID=2173173 RepID=A0A2V1HTB6_9MICO|nr:polyprenol monophosphomannose synthase [Amnibacterium flavum]PVZ95835.1 dolichol-phosphate mannosyltransferase [Amnibacterium flavum]
MPDEAAPDLLRAVVVLPTYNEVETLQTVVDLVLAADPRLDILVVDDGSPDGTGDLADRIATASERVSVLHRQTKDGLGRAYLSGFEWALGRGYDVLIEMDADGSHPAEQLGDLLDAVTLGGADLAIGSRWVPGGRVVDWSTARQALSRGGNTYARVALGIPTRDSTSGFRAYRAELLGALHLNDVHSRGYCFQIDMTLRAVDSDARVTEVPIEFRERISGVSKMSRSIVAEAMLRVTWWGLLRRLHLRRRSA